MTLRWVAIAGALVLLHLVGRGPLARPSLSGLVRRTGAPIHPPIETAMAAIRLLALGAGGYLLLVVTVALAGRLLGHRPTLALAARLTPPSLRATLALMTTVGVATVGVAAGGAGATPTGRPGQAGLLPPTLRWVAPPPNAATLTPSDTITPSAAPTLRWVAPATRSRPGGRPASRDGTPAIRGDTAGARPGPAGVEEGAARGRPGRPVRAGRTAPPAARATGPPHARPAGSGAAGLAGPVPVRGRAPRPVPGAPTGYVIRAGDSFWSIAARRVGVEGAGGGLTDERVARYWLRLVMANRADLPVPGQPDLLFPGDRIELPPVS